MLSRTASGLFWMARYLERAENLARVLDVTNKLSMMPRHSQQENDLTLPLKLTGTHQLFQNSYEIFSVKNLLNFFSLDSKNPCSIYSYIDQAWNNAHAVRGTLSSEVWECINTTRIDILKLKKQVHNLDMDNLFDWAKERSYLIRGAMMGSLLRNEAYCFIQIGTFIERTFATAQLLQLKDVQLHNDPEPVRQYYRLNTLLSAVSARETYHMLYRQPVSRETVIELLVCRPDLPRSLRSCVEELVSQLERLSSTNARIPLKLAHQLLVELRFDTIDDLLNNDLQHYLSTFLNRINLLADHIRLTYLEAL